ncbi:hypothetical protein BU23DRAFT_594654 [Bimuria novae-zelandiae CBS 107.79]|uniref:Uncharacterized protein n=1 Tax=Bimuria novae-zelandiae CBS 107.79 TaxID=1447943 RepID=A0A6A5VU69_9PLEO|nr:hypothetical protein BU23DRAFT_594654 [Bimuria novae-zelandiae CBS 107.79]
MPSEYISLYKYSQRSFLFYVVANVGPGGSTRPLAVAYRQGDDVSSPQSRIENLVNDILSLLKVLSESANRSPLETERVLATDWPDALPDSPPDSPQPPFRRWDDEWKPIWQFELLQSDAPRGFPFTSTCLVSGLLRDSKSTRTGDVQLQPLSTPFYGDCLEYGRVVVDISNLEHVRYGIVTFPVRYMVQVFYYSPCAEWDPLEDDPPMEEPDIVLVDERPREPLSIHGYLCKYFLRMRKDSKFLELEACPHVDDASVLDYIWPSNLQDASLVKSSKQLRPTKCSIM